MNALAPIAVAESLPAEILASLRQHAEDARGAYAPATERALKSDTVIFSAWCAAARLCPLPAEPSTLAGFIIAMAETKAPASIRRYVSSIAAMHRAAGAPNPAASERVKLAMKRLHREQGRAQRQAAPLGRPLVDRLLAVPVAGPKGLRNRAVLAVAYDTLARRSEMAALQVSDLVLEGDGSGTVLIQRSKTDQEGLGMVRFLASDTVSHLKAWLAAAGISEGPLFRTVRKGGRIGAGMCDGDVARIFKAMARAAGLPTEAVAGISGHSSRVGAAQDQMAAGIGLSAIMQSGGWQTSEMVARYTRRLDARRSGSAQLAAMRLRGGYRQEVT